MKMRNLLLTVILGLLAVVHSTPVNTVTQDPAKADEAFLKDAMTEGFIVNPPPSLTTESPKINTTVQVSQQPADMIEGSAVGETNDMSTTSVSPYATTPWHISRAQISESTEFEGSGLGEAEDGSTTPFALDTATTVSVTHASTSDFTQGYIVQGSGSEESPFFLHSTTTSVPSEARSGITSSYNVVSQITDAAASTRNLLRMGAGLGSGDVTETHTSPTMTVNTIKEAVIVPLNRSEQNQAFDKLLEEAQTQQIDPESSRKRNVTSDWIIILGLIAGVAALVMLGVAIATRHKWNQANQATPTVATSNSSNQQREQEMETFLPSDKPKENGNSAEYTVIPLEDLPEKDPLQ